jgi:DNA-binding transcriptional ArsR family regulator
VIDMGNVPPERPIDLAAVRAAQEHMLTPRNERRMRQILDALCDPTRVNIVRALSETTLAAGDLAQVIGRSRPATSQHLKVLRDLGAVVAKREGNTVRYSLSNEVSADIIENTAASFDRLEVTDGGD